MAFCGIYGKKIPSGAMGRSDSDSDSSYAPYDYEILLFATSVYDQFSDERGALLAALYAVSFGMLQNLYRRKGKGF